MIRRNSRLINRIFIALFVMILLSVSPVSAAAVQKEATVMNGIIVMMNGEKVKMTDPVLMLDGKLYVPVARMTEMFGAKSTWDQDAYELTIHNAFGDKMVLGDGVPVVYFNGSRYFMDTASFMVDGKTYAPLRDLTEMLHGTVKWNADEQVIELQAVQPAVVTEETNLTEISRQYQVSESDLVERNGLKSADDIKTGTTLRVIIPSILDNDAKPFTDKDYMLLAKLTQVEAGYESYEGQLAVANVILNRVADSRFPNAIRDVIYSGKQFPVAHNGILDKSVPNASVLRAAKDALNGKNNVEDAIYFFNPDVSKGAYWSSLEVITTIGNHSFAK
ncbi:LysM domain-containing protein [Fontibacillus panacisegetis]|uniref:LysM domain-containing protein n=1 Tax=Fontibacillus panacisegetis TaxID=670482 RepID=A0A1G7HBT9_9BACL|nr:cell wall hydrolase [Fontibacillus panacisegetis]SDE97579.1 LysM domain-containing protein [Fontibacillus panacisegetis]